MKDVRKTISQMIGELNAVRKASHKVFKHKKSGEAYQLINMAFDEETNELMAVYCIVAMPQIKFVRPMSIFLEKFEQQDTPRS